MCKVQKGREHRVTFDTDRSLGVVHHLSYVRVDKDLARKMNTFSHAGEEEVYRLPGIVPGNTCCPPVQQDVSAREVLSYGILRSLSWR